MIEKATQQAKKPEKDKGELGKDQQWPLHQTNQSHKIVHPKIKLSPFFFKLVCKYQNYVSEVSTRQPHCNIPDFEIHIYLIVADKIKRINKEESHEGSTARTLLIKL